MRSIGGVLKTYTRGVSKARYSEYGIRRGGTRSNVRMATITSPNVAHPTHVHTGSQQTFPTPTLTYIHRPAIKTM